MAGAVFFGVDDGDVPPTLVPPCFDLACVVCMGAPGTTTLAHGFDGREGLNDGQLFELLAAAPEPVEVTDMVSSVPRSPLVLPPHSMRWAYGAALRDDQWMVVGAVAVLDRWLRQLTKREQRAMGAVARQMTAQLSQWRRPSAAGSPAADAIVPAAAPAEPAPVPPKPPRNGATQAKLTSVNVRAMNTVPTRPPCPSRAEVNRVSDDGSWMSYMPNRLRAK